MLINLHYCSFCGKSPSDTTYMISGRDACICERCLSQCVRVISDRKKEDEKIDEDKIKKHEEV